MSVPWVSGEFRGFTPCLQFRPRCPAEPLGNQGEAALSLEFLGLWGQMVACSGSSQGGVWEGFGGQERGPRRGVQAGQEERVYLINRKAQSLGQGTHSVRKDMFGPTARWPSIGRPEHSKSALGLEEAFRPGGWSGPKGDLGCRGTASCLRTSGDLS